MSEVLTDDRGHVRWIVLNRPERMNAITGEMLGEINEALKAADDDSEVRVVVLTGAGRGFCSGLDLKQAAAGEGIGGAGLASAGARHYSTREICTVTLQRMDTPVIGAIEARWAGYINFRTDDQAQRRQRSREMRCCRAARHVSLSLQRRGAPI